MTFLPEEWYSGNITWQAFVSFISVLKSKHGAEQMTQWSTTSDDLPEDTNLASESSFNWSETLFLAFVAAVCAVYFVVPKNYRWVVLLLASYLFYWWNSAYLAAALAGTTVVTWLIGLALESKNKKAAEYLKLHQDLTAADRKSYRLSVTRKKKWILFLGILIVLGALLFFISPHPQGR